MVVELTIMMMMMMMLLLIKGNIFLPTPAIMIIITSVVVQPERGDNCAYLDMDKLLAIGWIMADFESLFDCAWWKHKQDEWTKL